MLTSKTIIIANPKIGERRPKNAIDQKALKNS